MTLLRQQLFDFAVALAATNWIQWRNDWEHAGDPAALPVLSDPAKHGTENDYARYRAFMAEYGVPRGVPNRMRMVLREELCGSTGLRNALDDLHGRALDQLTGELAALEYIDQKGTRRKIGRKIAYVSKLAAFAAPARFVASDRFARFGTVKLTKERGFGYHRNGGYPDYASYLADVNRLWRADIGELIRHRQCSLLRDAWPSIPVSGEAFGKRILDVSLMIAGGRWRATLGSLPEGRRGTVSATD